MSDLTYTSIRGRSRQAAGLAAWGDQDPALRNGCQDRGRNAVEKAATWRIVYRTDPDAIVIGEVFAKKTRTTPKDVIAICQRRFREYDDACK